MGVWDQALQDRIGPAWDAVCGTDGLDTDLNAVVAAGHKTILLTAGAVLTSNLTLTASNMTLFSFMHPRALNLGAYFINVDGPFTYLAGFTIDGSTDVGIQFTTNANHVIVERVASINNTSHGLQVSNTFNDHEIKGSYFSGNGGDGIKVGAGSVNCRITDCFSWNNTGYGVFDVDDSSILVGNRLNGNTAGAINGTPAIDVGNLKT